MNSPLFLDANAHLPICQDAINAFVKFNSSLGGHGHAMSLSSPGRAAANAIEEARAKIAGLLGTEANNLIFTSTCTQACEWAIQIIKSSGKKVYMTEMEHPAVKYAARDSLDKVSYLREVKGGVLSGGLKFDENDAVICINIQNEIGTIQPIENFEPGLLFTDMSQAVGKIPINLTKSNNIDIAVFGAHKFGGPSNIGILYLKDTSLWEEFGTGSRYYFDRPGTPDAASIVSTAAALEWSVRTLNRRYSKMMEFRDVLEPGLEDLGWKVIGKNSPRIPNTTFCKIPVGSSRLVLNLSSEEIYIGLGSACGSAHTGPSPLMTSLGYGGGADNYIRISQYGEYGALEAKRLLKVLNVYCPKKRFIE